MRSAPARVSTLRAWMPAAARCSPPAPGSTFRRSPLRRSRTRSRPAPSAPGTALSAIATASPASRSRPTTRRCTCPGPGITPRSPAPPARPSRSTSALPTPTAHSQRGPPHDDRGQAAAPADVGPRPRRGARARELSDAVVAVDVRRRARQAQRDLPGGVPGRGHARLPHRRPLRGRVAHHERRGRSDVAGPRHRPRAARAAVRGHRRGSRPRLHARGARDERRRDPPVRVARLRDDRGPPRLLHRQPRGRAHHVEGRGAPGVILGIETSCDETAAAVVSPDGVVLSSVVSSQAALHAAYGGVVPEVASRRHLELVVPAVERALADAGVTLDDIASVAVTEGPGLIGALLVGLSAAKALAFARRLPLVPVDHLHGHVAALYLRPDPVDPPFLCLLASGGHTLLLDVEDHSGFRVLGTTLD